MIELGSKCKRELIWWIQSSRLSNGKWLIRLPQQVTIQTDSWARGQFVRDRQQGRGIDLSRNNVGV